MKALGTFTLVLALAALVMVGCGDDSGPTGASPVVTSASAPSSFTSAAAPSARSQRAETADNVQAQRFSCDDLQGVRVRFSDPGFVTGPLVGLFAEYEGMPPGQKTLEIIWDEKNNPGEVERLSIGEGNVQGDGVKYDIAGLVAWIYDDLEGPEERQIRVNLRVEGRDGQCARVRRVMVNPGPQLGFPNRPTGNRGESGLLLSTSVGQPSGSRNRFAASASIKNVSASAIEGPIQAAFVTPPGYNVASSCRSGSSGGGTVICNVGVSRKAFLEPGETSETVSVVYESTTIGGLTSTGAIGVLNGGIFGDVSSYVVTGSSGLSTVTNLRELSGN